MPHFGFHPDPRDPDHLLLWDGRQWVDLEAPFNLALPTVPPPSRSRGSARTLLHVLVLCVCAGVATAAAGALLAVAVYMVFTTSATGTVVEATALAQGCDVSVQVPDSTRGVATLGVSSAECVPVGEELAVRYVPGASTAVLGPELGVLFFPACVALMGCLAVAVYSVRRP